MRTWGLKAARGLPSPPLHPSPELGPERKRKGCEVEEPEAQKAVCRDGTRETHGHPGALGEAL